MTAEEKIFNQVMHGDDDAAEESLKELAENELTNLDDAVSLISYLIHRECERRKETGDSQ